MTLLTSLPANIKHFTFAELSPHDKAVSFAPGFLDALQRLRDAYGQPMKVNSCARSAAYNKKIGGHPSSLHVWDKPAHNTGGCMAIDIAITDSVARAELVTLALAMNWSVGINRTFVHLDRRSDIGMKQALFLY